MSPSAVGCRGYSCCCSARGRGSRSRSVSRAWRSRVRRGCLSCSITCCPAHAALCSRCTGCAANVRLTPQHRPRPTVVNTRGGTGCAANVRLTPQHRPRPTVVNTRGGTGCAENVRLTPQHRPWPTVVNTRGGTIPEITMRYVSRYLSRDTILR